MSTRASLRGKVRNYLQKWPDTDVLQSAITATDLTLTVVDGARHPGGSILEVESELMWVRSVVGNVLTIRRGDRGTTAAAHAATTAILNHGQWDPTNLWLNDLIKDGIEWLHPFVLSDIWDESTTTNDTLLYYTVPTAIKYLNEVYITSAGTPVRKSRLRYWSLIGPRIYVPSVLPASRTLIFRGWGRFTSPSNDTDTLTLGADIEPAVEAYVVSCAVKAQETLRTRFTGQSATLEARAGNIPDLIGSSRDWMTRATALRSQHATKLSTMLRKVQRHG